MLDVEAKDWESICQCPRERAGEIPIMVLKAWKEFVSDSTSGLTERLCAWSFRVAVAAGLRWGDLLCTAPATLVLMKEGLIGFAEKKPKPVESLKEDIAGAIDFAFSNEKWLSGGFLLFQENTWDCARGFWIVQPLVLESEIGFPNQVPAFWHCANKMMSVLLPFADFHEDRGIRPHILKVETISALMGGNCQM